MQTRNCTLCKEKQPISKIAQYKSRWFCKIVKPDASKSCLEKVKSKKTRGTI